MGSWTPRLGSALDSGGEKNIKKKNLYRNKSLKLARQYNDKKIRKSKMIDQRDSVGKRIKTQNLQYQKP